MLLAPMVRQLYIKDKAMRIRRLEPNWAQYRYLDLAERQLATTGRIRIIVLKARQLGISTITEALGFKLSFVFPGYKTLVVAHEIPASQNLLEMTHRYWETYPYRPLHTPKMLSRNEIGWVDTGSSMKVATAGNKATGRSSTTHFLHASEVGFWPEARTTMLGLRQAIPDTFGTAIVMESTANGRGNYFHQQWQLAEEGETEFIPLFLPWHEHPEYRGSVIGIRPSIAGRPSEDERILRKMGVDDDRLAWRRWAIINKCDGDLLNFMQEYPSTPEEAFIASGMNVFPAEHLRACFKPETGVKGLLLGDRDSAEFKAAADGPLTLFRTPVDNRDWGKYMVAGDPTKTTRGDYAVAQVLNRRTMEQVAVWRGRLDPVSFADELYKLGKYFNDAEVTTEIEGPGYSTIGKLLGMNYPNVWQRQNQADKSPGAMTRDTHGWSTTMQTKQLAIGWLLRLVVEHSTTIHDRKTYDEMSNYVTLDNGGYGNAEDEEHDDTVMSYAIGVVCHQMSPPLPAYGQELAADRENRNEMFNEWQEANA